MEGGTLSEIYKTAQKLLIRVKDGLVRLEAFDFSTAAFSSSSSSSTMTAGAYGGGGSGGDKSYDDVSVVVSTDIAQIQSLCAEMDRLWRSIAPQGQRGLWKRKVEQVLEEVDSLKKSLDRLLLRRQSRIQAAKERTELFQRANGDSAHVLRIFDDEARAMESARNSSKMLDDAYDTAVAVLSKYAEQKDRLKRAQRKALDVMNTLGLSGTVLKLIERRHRTDKWIAYGAADSWLSFMDQLLTQKADSTEKECLLKKVIQLVDIYYDALDAPKTGKKVEVPSALKAERFPHYMEKATRSTTYKSTSVLGLIFDEVASQSYVCPPEDVWRKLPSFCYEPSPASLVFWKVQFSQYKSEMREALGLGHESKNLVADQIMLKYRKILYGVPEFESSTRSKEKVFDEALAIYHVVFEYANSCKDPGKFNFAWKVAGDALCALHVTKQENNSTTFCLLSVLSELLC